MQRADVAMYAAKRSGGGVAIYDLSQDPNSPDRLRRIADLRVAVETNAIEPYYQPIFSVASGELHSVEVLARWRMDSESFVPPSEFIPLAEEIGLICTLTRGLIERALDQAAAWQRAGYTLPVAINLSARTLLDASLPDFIVQTLAAHALPAEALSFEITEGAMMEDPLRALEVLNSLDRMGVRLAVDDFGTGYSSLTYLHEFPVDFLKIDRSFVQVMTTDPDAEAIVRSTIHLGHDLDLLVVAEGVEDEATLARLVELECDLVQGFHLGHPVAAEALEALLAQPAKTLRIG